MILIGENLNVMSRAIGPALKDRLVEAVQQLATAETRAGVDFLDLNIGPAKKSGAELMPWLVDAIQKVSDLPLSLDTTNTSAIAEGLKRCRRRALVNSVSLQQDRLEQILPLVTKYDSDVIGLLWGNDGMPRDVDERCLLAVELVYKTGEAGIPNENVWIDPIATPVSGDINQVKACADFLAMLPEIAPGCKSVVGLSNVSNGTPQHLRPLLNRTYLIMLARYGLQAAIVDAFDSELHDIARGRLPRIVDLVHRTMDDEDVGFNSLTKKEQEYVKTVRVLTGQTLYSHSWLET